MAFHLLRADKQRADELRGLREFVRRGDPCIQHAQQRIHPERERPADRLQCHKPGRRSLETGSASGVTIGADSL